MYNNDYFETNMFSFANNEEWKVLLIKIEDTKLFIDNLATLVFGNDMGIIRSAIGFRPVYINHILQSVAQTLHSMSLCAKFGNVADTYLLLRKVRDDLFFYLYVIITCRNEDIFVTGDFSRKENKINSWINNTLSDLNISEVIREIMKTDACKLLLEKYNLNDELKKIGKQLNNYTHGNGSIYYNRFYTRYKTEEIYQIAHELIDALHYIIVSFVFLLILLSPTCVRSSEYVDALDFSMDPEENSQYWVAPFVREFVEEHSVLLGDSALACLREITQMDI